MSARDQSLLDNLVDAIRRSGLDASQRSVCDVAGTADDSGVIVVADRSSTYALDCVRCFRESGLAAPIMVVTSADRPPHISVHAFAAGVSDCLTLPYNEHELVARISALLARSATTIAPDDLTRTERAILLCLSKRRGTWLTSQEIIEHALGTTHAPDTALVRVHIYNLRRKLAPRGVQIDSRRGRGYLLV